jgi:predicted RNase H-like nuclease (RuvC/YqgF family)
MKTIRMLKSQVKRFSEENKALKQELSTRASTIEKLEKSLVKI